MKILTQFLFLLAFTVGACNETDHKNNNPVKRDLSGYNEPVEGSSLLQLDDRLMQADSLVLVFYKDPHGTDSLRYTRYYTQYETRDTAIISFVKNNLNNPTVRFEKIKNCRSEGKIWCFNNGMVFQTLYFSAHSQACSFIYLIKNGQFYYSTLNKKLENKLSALKPLSHNLENDGL